VYGQYEQEVARWVERQREFPLAAQRQPATQTLTRSFASAMNEVLRQRLWRHIEALPEEQMYQVLDYIEFLSSKYARTSVRPAGSPLLRFGERLEDQMRNQGVALRAMRGALDAVSTADRVIAGLSEAGRSLLREVNEGLQAEAETPQRTLPAAPPPAPRPAAPPPQPKPADPPPELRDE
jgi:hypothetical protein